MEYLEGKSYNAIGKGLTKDGLKVRIDEIVEVVKGRQEALEEFDEGIFNALVGKIEVISPAHFVFELKSEMRVEG